jgi:adenosylcobinamide kinase/adenosylcobinamide-phosphate guanylyltransferase
MILITGGIKSGKSSLALELAKKRKGPRAFLATSEAFDGEMKARIKRHKAERGSGFKLYEEPTDIFTPLKTIKANVIVIDCITVWVSNLIYYKKDLKEYFKKFISSLSGNEIIVTNEVGLGVIPDNALSREYVDRLGEINKMLTKKADEVYLMVSGIKIKVK